MLPFKSTLPELTVRAPPASALVPLSSNLPPFTFVPPVKLLFPPSSSVPFPIFVRLDVPPLMFPPMLNVPETTLSVRLSVTVTAPLPIVSERPLKLKSVFHTCALFKVNEPLVAERLPPSM